MLLLDSVLISLCAATRRSLRKYFLSLQHSQRHVRAASLASSLQRHRATLYFNSSQINLHNNEKPIKGIIQVFIENGKSETNQPKSSYFLPLKPTSWSEIDFTQCEISTKSICLLVSKGHLSVDIYSIDTN